MSDDATIGRAPATEHDYEERKTDALADISLAEALAKLREISAQIEALECECRKQGASVRCGTCGVTDCIMNRA